VRPLWRTFERSKFWKNIAKAIFPQHIGIPRDWHLAAIWGLPFSLGRNEKRLTDGAKTLV